MVAGIGLLVSAAAAADTLVLRNGRRIAGELVEYRYDRVQWRNENGRTERIDRDDIRRIEFDDFGSDGSSFTSEDRPGSGRPSGRREREVSVKATEPWTSAGIEVERGQRIAFEAQGIVRWGKDRNHGPEGEKGSPRNSNRPMPSRNAAALIGRVGDGDPFYIGSDRGEIRVPESGTLYLGINDDYLQDNAGAFRVTVYY
jgi:hypothetical protein